MTITITISITITITITVAITISITIPITNNGYGYNQFLPVLTSTSVCAQRNTILHSKSNPKTLMFPSRINHNPDPNLNPHSTLTLALALNLIATSFNKYTAFWNSPSSSRALPLGLGLVLGLIISLCCRSPLLHAILCNSAYGTLQ